MFLVLTNERACAKNAEKRLLGRWCIDYRESLAEIEHLEQLSLVYPFDKHETLADAYQYLKTVDSRLFPQVCDALNQLHHVNHSYRYWRIIVGYWWQEFISGVYEKYICLKSAASQWPEASVKILIPAQWITPYDSYDFLQIVKNVNYNHQLYSQIIVSLNLFNATPFTTNELSQLAMTFSPLPPQPNSWVNLIKKGFVYCSRWNRYYIVASYIPKSQLCKLALKLKTFPTLADAPRFMISKTRNINRGMRRDLTKLTGVDEFEKLIIDMWGDNLPKVYCEDFLALIQKVNYYYPKKPVHAILTAAAYSHNDGFKVFAAQQTESYKTPLLITQHGAHYGTAAWNPSEDYEKEISDYFITYGWPEEKNKKVVPGIINLFTDYSRKPNGKASGNIIWVFTSQQKFPRMLYAIRRGPQIIDYLNEQAIFFNHLSSEARNKIRIRPYKHDCGWYDLEYLQKKITGTIHISQKQQSLRDEAKSASLVICTYDSTSILEMFALNIPTLLYWNPNYTPRRGIAVSIYRTLHELGILHYDPVKAATHLSEIHQNPTGWWQQPKIQAAREEFSQMFAKTSSNYTQTWQQTIERLSVKQ